MAVLLNVQTAAENTAIVCDCFSCPINESSVYSASLQCYKDLDESEQIIKSKVAQNNVVHVDGNRLMG